MADKPNPDKTAPLSPTQAAKRVGIPLAELYSYRDYGTHVVVVTVQGQKLDSRGPAPGGVAGPALSGAEGGEA